MVDRKKLDEIILRDHGNNWWNPDLFHENTLALLPAELEIVQIPPENTYNYNCFLYVLNLYNDQEIIKDCKGFLQDTFFQKMIDLGELEKTDNPMDGDYIAYQDLKRYPTLITHVGVVNGAKVVSKWAWGPLIRHDIWDVPDSYGETMWYIKSISNEKAKELYWKYKEFNLINKL